MGPLCQALHELGLHQRVVDDSRNELRSTRQLGSLLASAGLVISGYR